MSGEWFCFWCGGVSIFVFVSHTVRRMKKRSYLLKSDWLTWGFMQTKAVESLKQTLKSVALEESRKRDLTTAIHAYFKEWLYCN